MRNEDYLQPSAEDAEQYNRQLAEYEQKQNQDEKFSKSSK
jgi:hypothetical protein